MKFKRIFLIVMDSVGIGALEDAARFHDENTNTWLHTAQRCGGLNVPTIESFGIHDLCPIPGTESKKHPHAYCLTLREKSNGKDTLTGHWEMMGLYTPHPLVTFTDTGFPEELIDELEKRTGRKVIGNYSESGTVILTRLGEEQTRDGSLIVYTSADSVLQIAANTATVPLEELYRDCEIAREITMKPDWRVGRVIARPFVGTDKTNFKRTSDRRDYSLSPSGTTVLDLLKESGKDVIAIGKIHDIFNGVGITESIHTVSNEDGMDKTIAIAKEKSFDGLCFVNLVEFDSLYGHRRDPIGYGKAIESFDKRLGQLLPYIGEEDLLLVTADHGNDPTHTGTDHTRERVPLFSYSPAYTNGEKISEEETFAVIGQTILANFGIPASDNLIGRPVHRLLCD